MTNPRRPSRPSFWYQNGLSLVLLALMLACWGAQSEAGRRVYNHERAEHQLAPLSWGRYLRTGHFASATFENWESEFLQMGMYVLLTVWLRQRGSAESRKLDARGEDGDIEPGPAPWPVRRGGWWLRLYRNSLSAALLALFLASFSLHLWGSWRSDLAERAMKHEAPESLVAYAGGAEFWFESFQNWQSEFLAVFSLVLLSIWLRQANSPESKPVAAPHAQTGS